MFILKAKLQLCLLSFIFIHSIHTNTTLAQPNFIAHYCENASTYTINSTYQRNLNTTLATLPATDNGFGFYNLTTGQGNDTVHSVALCRGDVNPDVCRSCVNDSIVRLGQLCPNQKEAIVYYDYCLMKYSNEVILRSIRIKFYQPYANSQNATDINRFNGALGPLLSRLRGEAAAGGDQLKFASGSTNETNFSNIYGLVQCTPDLSQQQCSNCLEDAINQISSKMNGSVGGRILLPMCNFRYEISQFFNQTARLAPPSSPPPPPDFTPTVGNTPPSTKKNSTRLVVGIAVPVAVVIFLLLLALYFYRQRKKKQDSNNNYEEFLGIDAKPYTFTYGDLRAATDDFSPTNKLGEGGFGPVYKGTLDDGRVIAVKQLSIASHQGKSQFVAEIATISAVQHRNLVKLYGCCIDGEKLLLVYEYLEKKSLDKALFGENKLSISWATRVEICLGIARGLAYLHEESRIRVVHRDVKASNVLLDSELNPKISDFGLAKLYDYKKTHMSTRVAGTIGYLAPEYAMRGHLTEKADVFGFGVVALEIVSGRPNFDSALEDQMYLLEWAWNLHEANNELELVDEELSEFDANEVKRVIRVALLCTQTSPVQRPSMSRVVAMILGDIEASGVIARPVYLTDFNFEDATIFKSGVSTSGSDCMPSTSQYAVSHNIASAWLLNDVNGEGG